MSEKMNLAGVRPSLTRGRHRRQLLAAAVAVGAAGVVGSNALAVVPPPTTRPSTWIGPTDPTPGAWENPSNWAYDDDGDTGTAPVNVVPSASGNHFAMINNGGLAEVTVDSEAAFLTLGTTWRSAGDFDTGHLKVTSGTLTLGELRVGGRETLTSLTGVVPAPNDGGTGTVLQTGGTVNVTYTHGQNPDGSNFEPPIQSLYIGDSGIGAGPNHANGTYTITGGALNVGIANDDAIIIGTGIGTQGAFVQQGGAVTSSGIVDVGRRGANGSYTMSAGTLNVNGVSQTGVIARPGLYVGDGDSTNDQTTVGTFTQTGGTVTIPTLNGTGGASNATVDIGPRSGTGSYTISGGSLTTPSLNVGGNTNNNTTASLFGKGTLTVRDTADVNITGNMNAALSSNDTALTPGDTRGTVNIEGGTLDFSADGAIFGVGNGRSSTGVVNQTGGTVTMTTANSELNIGRFGGTGTYNLNGGTLNTRQILIGGNSNATQVANGEVTVDGGTLDSDNITIVSASPGAPATATRILNIKSGTVTLDTLNNGTSGGGAGLTRTVNISGGTTSISGVLTGGVNVTYNITGGTTTVGGASAFRNDAANPTVMNVNTAGSITFNNSGTSLTLNASTLNIGAGGTFNANSLITNTGQLNISGGTVNIASGAFPGTLTLSSNSTLKTDNAISLASNILMGSVNVNVNSGSLALTGPITSNTAQTMRKAGPGTLTISGTQSHALNSAINNESGGGILNLNANGGTNLGINASSGTTNFGATQTLRQITVNSGAALNVGSAPQTVSTTSAVTLNNGSISGSATVTGASYAVQNGSISAPLAGGGALTKTSANTVTLSGANSYTGGTTVSAGTLVAGHGDAFAGGSVNVADSALAQAQAGLPKAVTVSTLTTNTSGKLDLTNNSMVVKGMTDAQVRTQLQAGYNGGAWNGATGITSSAVNSSTSVGYASNTSLGLTEFKGVTGLTGTDVMVKYTYAGDANLDGKVDIGDLGLLAGAWQQLTGKVWFDGDFTYDGAVNIGDLGLLAGNWQKGTAGNPNPPLMDFNTALAQFSAFDGVAVPEPTSLALLGLGGLAALGRRRRRSH